MKGILVKIQRREWNRLWGSDRGRNFYEEGRSAKLVPKYNRAMIGSDKLESFQIKLEIELLYLGWDTVIP